MKKKFVTLLVFAMLGVSTLFAGGNDAGRNAQATFSDAFATATNVKWEKEKTWYKASFNMNGQFFQALLSEEGEMIAVSRNILSTELPAGLQAALSEKLPNYWISGLVQYTLEDVTRYYVTLEDADHKTILENDGSYDWSLLKKTAK